jgi:hypothetical protein
VLDERAIALEEIADIRDWVRMEIRDVPGQFPHCWALALELLFNQYLMLTDGKAENLQSRETQLVV